MPTEVLWISQSVPYDSVPHASGKIHNYYLKKIHEHDDIDVSLITFCSYDVIDKIDLDKYGIKNYIFYRKPKTIKDIYYKLLNQETNRNPLNKYANYVYNYTIITVMKKLKALRKEGYYPKVIILEWTQIVLLISQIKKIFPNAKIISIEEDVAFLGFQRKTQNQQIFKKYQQQLY